MRQLLVASLLLFLAASTLPSSAQLIQPEDLEYRGAFRLPEGSNGSDWNYSGYAMTYYPDGDPEGPSDGYPGSIFAIGHDHHQYISEISIPIPVISQTKDVNQLNTATTLQPFRDVTGGLFGALEIPRAGLEYLPPQGTQTTGKLHFCWGQHFQFEQVPSHGWCECDLSNPQTAGAWIFSNYTNYITNDYIFEIPEAWAATHTPGQRLATGRFRDGGWGGQGPTLFAYGPWNDGNPPAPNDTLRTITPLLLYGIHQPGVVEITNDDSMKINGYKEADEWSGGAWLTVGDNASVIFVGTKGTGNCWYGFSDGTVWPDSAPYPDVPPYPHDDRGWWTDDIQAQILFYSPTNLAAVASGTMETWEPQPYATLNIDPYLFDPGFTYERYKRYSVGASCFDRTRGFLYIVERRADEDKSLIHVWKCHSQPTGIEGRAKSASFELFQNYPNPFNPSTKIRYSLQEPARIKLTIHDLLGRELVSLVDQRQSPGSYEIVWDGKDREGRTVCSGIHYYRIKANDFIKIRKMILMR